MGTDAAPPPPPPPPQRPPPLGPTVSQSTRNDALTGELRQIEREFDAALQPFEDRTLDVLDRVRTAEIDGRPPGPDRASEVVARSHSSCGGGMRRLAPNFLHRS